MIKNYIGIFAASCFGGWLFSMLHIPLPWTLGPLATVIFIKTVFHQQVYWPIKIRNMAVLVLGYVLGSPFTPQTAHHILAQLPAILVMTLISVSLCLIGGYVTGKYLDLHLSTSLLGSMPGGLPQMTMVCEDVEGSDVAVVTMMQTVRILVTVFTVPFLVLHGLADQVDTVARAVVHFDARMLPRLALFGVVIIGSVSIANAIRLPSPFLVAPVLSTAALVLYGVEAPVLPYPVIALAQVGMSIRMGMAVEVSKLQNSKRLLLLTVLSVFLVILALLGIDYLLSRISGIPFVTAFLSTAPGGITEMGLTTMMVHGDLSTVIAFQLVRLLFVLLVAIPALTWWLCRRNKQCIRYSPLE